jgi:hypothetical protein
MEKHEVRIAYINLRSARNAESHRSKAIPVASFVQVLKGAAIIASAFGVARARGLKGSRSWWERFWRILNVLGVTNCVGR